MSKPANRIILALEISPAQRTLARLAATQYVTCSTTAETQIRALLSDAAPVFAIVIEPTAQGGPGFKMLELARSLKPQAFRVVISNFSEIAELIEGVHSGLVQRVLTAPVSEDEARAFLKLGGSTTAPIMPRAMAASSAVRQAS